MTLTTLESLRRQYLSLYPLYLISFPEPSLLANPQSQKFLIDKLLGESHQPENEYRRKFWRRVVESMEIGLKKLESQSEFSEEERDELEIDERFYDLLTDLMVTNNANANGEAGPSSSGPKTTYRAFIYDKPNSSNYLSKITNTIDHGIENHTDRDDDRDEDKIVLLEEQIAIQGGTTGLRTWTAALNLAHHILRSPHLVLYDTELSHRGILELGAGTGFLSILLAQLGADVISTDLGIESDAQSINEIGTGQRHEEDGESRTPLGRLKYNVQLSVDQVSVKALDWADGSLLPEERPNIWSKLIEERRTIVAADVIYDPDLVPPLVNTIDVLLDDDGQNQAIISATVRNQETFDQFLITCGQHHLQVSFIEVPPINENGDDVRACPPFWDSALDKGTEVKIMRINKLRRL
ncbi:hypothetical protein L486_00200 [Kwoniella mangroviensis CBS 10435]|uniref:FAM86 N-terminal domain-containing protein n=1 Tax=Kwoniella mangroviensis CBS 10435 TaxID=1331196 RepID=A0A1B9IYF3_9TREE|nr:hypothetical protein L486_00200 [Kwoniella mangroviensis CBS 10435]